MKTELSKYVRMTVRIIIVTKRIITKIIIVSKQLDREIEVFNSTVRSHARRLPQQSNTSKSRRATYDDIRANGNDNIITSRHYKQPITDTREANAITTHPLTPQYVRTHNLSAMHQFTPPTQIHNIARLGRIAIQSKGLFYHSHHRVKSSLAKALTIFNSPNHMSAQIGYVQSTQNQSISSKTINAANQKSKYIHTTEPAKREYRLFYFHRSITKFQINTIDCKRLTPPVRLSIKVVLARDSNRTRLRQTNPNHQTTELNERPRAEKTPVFEAPSNHWIHPYGTSSSRGLGPTNHPSNSTIKQSSHHPSSRCSHHKDKYKLALYSSKISMQRQGNQAYEIVRRFKIELIIHINKNNRWPTEIQSLYFVRMYRRYSVRNYN